jgi:hypothetical protein
MGHIVRKAKPRVSVEPFSGAEQQIYDIIKTSLYRLGRTIDADALAKAIVSLQPDVLAKVLTSLTIGDLQLALRQGLIAVLNNAGKSAVKEIQPVISATPSWGNEFTVTGKPNTKLRFDVNNPLADDFAEKQAGRLVTAIDESMRLAIRTVISESFKNQVPLDLTASRLRQFVGLHPRWALAVDRYYTRQYESLRNKGITHEKALKRAEMTTETYRRRLIRARSSMIARTEIQIAQNWGRQLAWQQASDGGWVDPDAQKVWKTASATMGGVPPCDRCSPMEGESVRWNQSFSNGLLMPPAHPHCRCTAFLMPPNRGLNDDEYIRTGIAR